MENYIGSQQHWEDNINARYDENERINKGQVDNREQPDNRVQEYDDELLKNFNKEVRIPNLNRKLSEFMGYKFNAYPEYKHNNITRANGHKWFYASWDLEEFNKFLYNDMKYHKSYDWLMPVWFKFRNLYPEIKEEYIRKEFNKIKKSVKNSITSSDIETAYSDISVAIAWYNQYLADKKHQIPINELQCGIGGKK